MVYITVAEVLSAASLDLGRDKEMKTKMYIIIFKIL